MNLVPTYKREIFAIAYNAWIRYGGKFILEDLCRAIEDFSFSVEEKDRLKFKGDMFEVFAYFFFRYIRDPSIGLEEYKSVPIEEDYGVDGFGISPNGLKSAVQVKYRSNPNNLVLYSEISKTFTSGQLMLKLDMDRENSIFVFTNAIDVTPACKHVLGDRLKLLGRDQLKHYVDNYVPFWKHMYERLEK